MNKNIIEYISNIIDKLYSNKKPIGINKKVLHTVLKNNISADLKKK